MSKLPVESLSKSSSILATISIILFLSGFYLAGSLFFAGKSWYFKFFIVIIFSLASALAIYPTTYYSKIINLLNGSRIEIYKVFWPSKDESIKTTLLVLLIVAVFAIFFTIVDGLLTMIVKWII